MLVVGGKQVAQVENAVHCFAMKDAPKLWIGYIRKILHHEVQKYFPNMSDVPEQVKMKHCLELHCIVKFINAKQTLQVILKMANRKVQFRALPDSSGATLNGVATYFIPRYLLNPIGQFKQRGMATDLKICNFLNCVLNYASLEYEWNFNLDPKLGLQITFEALSFILGDFVSCHLWNVTVWSGKQNDSTDKTLWERSYCGSRSSTVTYPPFSDTKISLFVLSLVTYNLQVSYTVIDINRVYTIPDWMQPRTTTILGSFWVVGQEKVLLKFLVSVKKHQRIILRLPPDTAVYNGPGILSPKPKVPAHNKEFYVRWVVCKNTDIFGVHCGERELIR